MNSQAPVPICVVGGFKVLAVPELRCPVAEKVYHNPTNLPKTPSPLPSSWMVYHRVRVRGGRAEPIIKANRLKWNCNARPYLERQLCAKVDSGLKAISAPQHFAALCDRLCGVRIETVGHARAATYDRLGGRDHTARVFLFVWHSRVATDAGADHGRRLRHCDGAGSAAGCSQ